VFLHGLPRDIRDEISSEDQPTLNDKYKIAVKTTIYLERMERDGKSLRDLEILHLIFHGIKLGGAIERIGRTIVIEIIHAIKQMIAQQFAINMLRTIKTTEPFPMKNDRDSK